MKSLLPLFPSTVVGSMPRPQYVKDLLAAGSRTGAHDAGWQRRMNDAVRFSIGMQEQAGIDIVSDGEWRRESYVDVVGEIMHGFAWVPRETFAYHQMVVERMRPRRPGVIAEEARFLKENGVDVQTAGPQFVDPARNLQTWDASLGGPGTVAGALSKLRVQYDPSAAGYDARYTTAALLAYLRHFDGGVGVDELPTVQPMPVLGYLVSREWVGLSEDRRRVWLLADARRALGFDAR